MQYIFFESVLINYHRFVRGHSSTDFATDIDLFSIMYIYIPACFVVVVVFFCLGLLFDQVDQPFFYLYLFSKFFIRFVIAFTHFSFPIVNL